jgi:hypothetical protein
MPLALLTYYDGRICNQDVEYWMWLVNSAPNYHCEEALKSVALKVPHLCMKMGVVSFPWFSLKQLFILILLRKYFLCLMQSLQWTELLACPNWVFRDHYLSHELQKASCLEHWHLSSLSKLLSIQQFALILLSKTEW